MKQLSTFNGDHFVLHLNKDGDRPEHSTIKDFDYDLMISSKYAYAPTNKDELKKLADFIYQTINENE